MIKDVDQTVDKLSSGKEDKMIKDADQPGDGDQSTSGKEDIMIKEAHQPGQDGMLKVITFI